MLTYMNDFLSRYPYPAEAKKEFTDAMAACLDSGRASTMFSAMMKRYEDDMRTDFNALIEDMKTVSQMLDISESLGNALMIIALTKQLKVYYKENGYSEELFYRSMNDILYKTLECKEVRGMYGIFVPSWYQFFFRLEIFMMQRLQFQITKLHLECTVDGEVLTPGTPILSIHIPRTGTPMNHDTVLTDYDEAAKFFKEHGLIERPIFMCSSWLLFKRHRDMLSENSNIIKFMNDFTMVQDSEYPDYKELWRLFDMEYTDVDSLPADSTLRRGYIDLVRKGEKTGRSTGIFIYK